MPRPRKLRLVQGGPMSNVFKPKGIPGSDLEEVIISLEGFEAIRLIDFEKMDQGAAAERMNVSRQTFGRILSNARGLIAEALVKGKMIRIHGGDYVLPGERGFKRRRRGRI